MAVMVLNSSYQPIAWWPINRAIVAIYLGKAQVVKEQKGAFIHSVKESFPVPAMIRLPKAGYVRPMQQAFSRRGVFKRDDYTCQYCGCKEREQLTLDHIHPKSRGGEDSWDNCTTACLKCNTKKGDKSLEDLGWKRPKTGIYLFFDFAEVFGEDFYGG
jgi:5-methylcytosine-specific restriction endonuclease McrA